jgi:general stress protein 26|tara:strand:+ start:753 stop:1172 length:420 start_codon:yes stop_codon:yes gene_type:complete
MAKPDKKMIAETMRSMDLCMMTTHGEGSSLTSRPMSNNAQVDYDGDSFFFTAPDTRKLRDIDRDKHVALDFQGDGIWLTIRGTASVHNDPALIKQHWTPDIEKWFGHGPEEQGGVRIIKVTANEAELYGENEGVVDMGG